MSGVDDSRCDEAHVLMLGWDYDDDDVNKNQEMRRELEQLETVSY